MNFLMVFALVCGTASTAHAAVALADASSDQECNMALETLGTAVPKANALENAIRKGLWQCAEGIARLGAKSGVSGLRNTVDVESRIVSKRIADLKEVIESSLPVQVIAPAYQWAQSATEVFLSVKFSHKLDAPATLNVEANTVTVTDQKLSLEASNGRKSFVLDLDLFGEVQGGDAASFSMASVGRMTFTLKKKEGERSKWPRLLATEGKKPGNQHFWYSQAEQYTDELDELDGEDADEKEEKEAAKKEKELKDAQLREHMGLKPKGVEAEDDDDDDDKDEKRARARAKAKAKAKAEEETVAEETEEEKAFKAARATVVADYKAKIDELSSALRKKKRSIDDDAKKGKSAENVAFSAEKKRLKAEEEAAVRDLRAQYKVSDEL